MAVDEPREFVIPVRRRWTLWILPTIAILYFLAVVTLAILRREINGVPTQWLVLGGVGLFVLVILVELPFFVRRRIRAEPEAALPAATPDWQDEAPEPATRGAWDDERIATAEEQQGLRVLEYSAPAKSRNRGSVYAKTYVPVTKEHVLRVETLAAEPHEL